MALGGNPVFNSKSYREQTGPNAATATFHAQPNLSAQELQDLYTKPSAGPQQTGRMTYASVINKTMATFAVLLIGAVIGWQAPGLMIVGAIVGLVLGLVNSFKKQPSPILILLYAGFEGLFVGGLSGYLEAQYPGIAGQAVLATLSVFAVVLVLYRSGKYRATPKMTKMFMAAMIGYVLFSLLNFVLMITGVAGGQFGMRSGLLGIGIGILAVLLATYALVLDFTSISEGVRNGAPEKFSWTAAFGLTVTMVWLYIEILRILAILRGDD
ncbi:Bax inhibitor-1/YccA family protein [Paeniglutamicibacter cryotolerans]|uniref:Putative YccA/Bax inhibitor family protein n=1 Tax=Paeniglutamicibacter cryotolerans TaxID=670079 RepID=A0A839QIB3_9MICC|nr:Bax inhibitor-1/YccA family protein [Paeniglutamicibacter cryotolerans]MBB2995919.1 putative YccA/Bax inhibitor family protein [Paeniglutamicibacter cryotolerans]